jgi:hypothetical protein
MKMTSKSGAAIAAAAATLFLAGATMSSPTYAAGEGKCVGANACKGQSACKGGTNSCKGMNACKTTGISMAASEAACKAKGGAKANF